MSNQRYMMRGVSASKEDVHNAIKNIDKGIFPQAFCKIIPDILGFPAGLLQDYPRHTGRRPGVLQHHARRRRRHQVLTGLHVLEGDGRPLGVERHRAGRTHHEHRRPALRGRGGQHPRTNCWPSCVKWAWASMPRAARRPTWATWCAPSS